MPSTRIYQPGRDDEIHRPGNWQYCPECGYDNPADHNECVDCGSSLPEAHE